MTLVTEILLVSGVALDLVGAGVLSHAHNAESIAELREDIGEEGAAVGEPDALSTHAQLLAEKRIGFLLLTLGLVLYLSGVVLKSPEGLAMMASIAGGVVMAGLVIRVVAIARARDLHPADFEGMATTRGRSTEWRRQSRISVGRPRLTEFRLSARSCSRRC